MFSTGLVSISFRDQDISTIIQAAAKHHLNNVEWGSDVHAPPTDLLRLQHIADMQYQYGITCCSYGTYFRLGYTPIEELPKYITAAKVLGTRILRLWAGRKKAVDCTEEERDYLFSQCRQAALLAEKNDVILCLECHRRSYTETMEGALELMQHVNSAHFRMYWQPNPDISFEDNLRYISTLRDYIIHIHVFHWVRDERLPLCEGIAVWKEYLSQLHRDHDLLLEFMPDDNIQSLGNEAESLKKICQL